MLKKNSIQKLINYTKGSIRAFPCTLIVISLCAYLIFQIKFAFDLKKILLSRIVARNFVSKE